MDSSHDIFTGGTDLTDDARQEIARQAVKNFRKMQPTLSAFARMLTGRKNVRVEVATYSNGSTDGTRIFYRPPMALGSMLEHERRMCDRRDGLMQPLCPACAQREEVLVVIYHEIAHICYESFAKVSESTLSNFTRDAVAQSEGRYAEAILKRIDSASEHVKYSYMGLASLISEWLPIIVNSLEDARVNRRMFKSRPGTRVMFDALIYKIFREGVEQVDPNTGQLKTIMWYDYPLNLQIILGLFCKASGYKYAGWFTEKVIEDLSDPQLTSLVARMDTIRSAGGVYHLSFPVLVRLRELGYCRLPEDPEDEFDEETQEDEQGEGSDGETSDTSSESDGEATGSATDEASPSEEEDTPDEGSPSTGDDVSDDSGDGGSGDEPEPDFDSSDGSSKSGSASSTDRHGETDSTRSSDRDRESEDEEDEELAPEEDEAEGTSPGDAETEETDSDVSDSAEGDTGSSGRPDDLWESDDTPGDTSGSEDDSVDNNTPSSDNKGESNPSDSSDESDEVSVESDEDALSLPEDNQDEAIDTGEDRGQGGIEVINEPKSEPLPMGTPDEAKAAVKKLGDHEELPKSIDANRAEEEAIRALDKAIVQGAYFETPSTNIHGIREHRWDSHAKSSKGRDMASGWRRDGSILSWTGYGPIEAGIEGDFVPSEHTLHPALMRLRRTFSDNAQGGQQTGLKSGRIDRKLVGRRAPLEDERFFHRRTRVEKKSYFVIIGIDISGSTIGVNLKLAKRAAYAQAELCSRVGVDFAVYAHSGNFHDGLTRDDGIDLDIYIIKDSREPWNDRTRERLTMLAPAEANLDGHTIEYYRKVAADHRATDKIIMYYSDGQMPAENFDEELEILQREIKTCKRLDITLMGVGIRTDSPTKYGLDTVRVDDDADIINVVRHLERRLRSR